MNRFFRRNGHRPLAAMGAGELSACRRANQVRYPPWPAHVLLYLVASVLIITATPAPAADTVRVGFQSTGTFAWMLDVIRRHGLADGAGLDLRVTEFASPDAGKLALNSGTVDIAISDWLWVARERALGGRLLFYPYSNAVGAVMVRQDSPVKEISDLRGRVLAVAGGPLDKSWLIVRAAALRRGIDLKRETTLQYGAPPLMFHKVRQGEAHANLNFWNFCARLEAAGFRRLLDVRDAEAELGIAEPVAMIGYVFSEAFVASHRKTLDRFLEVTKAAYEIMERSDAEWDALRPVIKAEDEATFAVLRDRTRAGIPKRSLADETADARKLFKTLVELGGSELVGPARELDPNLYYNPATNAE